MTTAAVWLMRGRLATHSAQAESLFRSVRFVGENSRHGLFPSGDIYKIPRYVVSPDDSRHPVRCEFTSNDGAGVGMDFARLFTLANYVC